MCTCSSLSAFDVDFFDEGLCVLDDRVPTALDLIFDDFDDLWDLWCGALPYASAQPNTRECLSTSQRNHRVCRNPVLKGATSFLTQTTICGTSCSASPYTSAKPEKSASVHRVEILKTDSSHVCDTRYANKMIKVYWHTVELCDMPNRSYEGHERKK